MLTEQVREGDHSKINLTGYSSKTWVAQNKVNPIENKETLDLKNETKSPIRLNKQELNRARLKFNNTGTMTGTGVVAALLPNNNK